MIDILREEFKEKVNHWLKLNVSKIFEKHTTLKAFRFETFIPSYNDGEPCEPETTKGCPKLLIEDEGFIRDKEFYKNNPDGWRISDFDGEYTQTEYIDEDEFFVDDDYKSPIYQDVKKFLTKLEDNDLYYIFGLDKQITIYKDGRINIQSYECGY